MLLKSDDVSSPHFRPIFTVYGDNSGETGEPSAFSEANRTPVSTMYRNQHRRSIDSILDRKRARERGAFLVTPELTGEKGIATGQRRRSSGRHSGEVRQGSRRRGERSAVTTDDDENGGGMIRNGDVLSMTEFDEEPSIQNDLEQRKEENGYDKNRLSPGDVAYHDDGSVEDSTATDSRSRLESPPESEERQYEYPFPNRQQRWSTDAVRVWGKKRAWEMDPVRVWGKRRWEMDPVRVWGRRRRDWEMDPVRVWGKRAWEMDPVRVWGKRAWGSDPVVGVPDKRAWDNDSVRVWGKREWETDPVRVWGK